MSSCFISKSSRLVQIVCDIASYTVSVLKLRTLNVYGRLDL